MEMAKAQLWEWNQFDELKRNAEKRYKNYLGSWLVMCVAAFSAYVGFPNYYCRYSYCWFRLDCGGERASSNVKKSRQPTKKENSSVADWSYIRQRLDDVAATDAESSPTGRN